MIHEGYENTYMPNITFEYPIQSPVFQANDRNRNSPSSRKAKIEPSLSEPEHNGGHGPGQTRRNTLPLPVVRGGDPSQSIALDQKRPSPKMRGKGRGRGKGNIEQGSLQIHRGGRGRATSQGFVLQIPHQGRDEALAEQALKRKRTDVDEPQDDTEDHILQELLTKDTVEKGISGRKRKAEGKGSKREHHACDRCFRNKTKVSSYP
jgi:hypothetical protein